jgi:mono/diheme cytochrome c family protein
MRRLICLVAVIAVAVGAGCAKNGGGASAGSNDAALIAQGKGVYDANGCARCHTLGGSGGRMGPDLTHAGAEPTHTPQWLAEHVKNPRAQNHSSRMPAFEGRIRPSDLSALGVYLASLK